MEGQGGNKPFVEAGHLCLDVLAYLASEDSGQVAVSRAGERELDGGHTRTHAVDLSRMPLPLTLPLALCRS